MLLLSEGRFEVVPREGTDEPQINPNPTSYEDIGSKASKIGAVKANVFPDHGPNAWESDRGRGRGLPVGFKSHLSLFF